MIFETLKHASTIHAYLGRRRYRKNAKRLDHANPQITLEFYVHLLPNTDWDIADTFH